MNTTREQRIQAQILYNCGHTYKAIAQTLHLSIRQIRYANKHRITPQKHNSGRQLLLNEGQIDLLIDYVSASKANRRTTFFDLGLVFECSEKAITNALHSRGYKRHVARRKPQILPKNQALRLAFAVEHLDWTKEQWGHILWTDET